MDFRGQKTGFQEADLRYAELKRQHDAGILSHEEFDAQRRHLMVQDDEGRWWAKARETGEWHYHDGSAWVQGTPPGYQPSPTPPPESLPDSQPQSEQGERSPSPQTALPGDAPIQDQNRETWRRGVPRGVVAGAGLLAVVLVVVGVSFWLLVPAISGGAGSSSGESSGAASGYALFKHDSGALSVEVPSEWSERMVVDSEGEKGRTSWSSYSDDGESAGPSMTAVNDLYSWRNGTPGHQGVYAVVSKNLAQEYTDEELVTSGPNDYSSSCEAGTIQDFDRPSYSGKILRWENCGGDSEHTAVALALAPEDRECVIVAQIGGYFRTQTDEENIQHVLDTFEADCSRID